MSEKEILILLASHNGEKYIAEQIESIQAQSCSCWHLIIRDDGSTDDTSSCIEAFLGDDRITFIQAQDGTSAQDNFAELMNIALGTPASYVMLADQDDVWRPDKIERLLHEMHEMERTTTGTSTPLLIHANLEVVDACLRLINPSFHRYQGLRHEAGTPLRVLLAQNFVTGCTIMFNRQLLELAVPLPRESLMHDWWLALLAAAAGRIGFIDAPLVRYRQHGRNQVGAASIRDKLLHPQNSLFAQLRKGAENYRRSIQQAKALLARLDERSVVLCGRAATLIRGYGELAGLPRLQRLQRVIAAGVAPQHPIRHLLFYWRVLTA